MSKVGRNDPCPCGSGKKYKKCHLGVSERQESTNFSIRERNLILLSEIASIFKLKKGDSWEDFRKNIKPDSVKQLYSVIGSLWPPNTNLLNLLPKPNTSLRALYLGDIHPFEVPRNITRYSLYCDQILAILPFLNPWTIREDYNPLKHPEEYIVDTIKIVAYISQLEPWIRSGIVELMPEPGDFDYDLRLSTMKLAEARWEREGREPSKEDFDKFVKKGKEDMKRHILWSAPKEYYEKVLRKDNPKITDEEIKRSIEIADQIRRADPLAPFEPSVRSSGMFIARSGTNLEMGMYISQLTGSFMYTNLKTKWDEILSISEDTRDNVWSPLTNAFQQLEFNFLGNIDPKFAVRLREDGRLEGFRVFLREIWQDVHEHQDSRKANSSARDLSDRLVYEHKRAEEEWVKIDKDLLKWLSGEVAASTVAVAKSLELGGFTWVIPTGGLAIAAVSNLLKARISRGNFAKTVPMSVFLDLEKKDKVFK